MSRRSSREHAQRARAKKRSKKGFALEQLEAKNLLAADLVSLSPPDGGANVAADANLVLTFSDAVQKGPGTGNIFIHNADDGSLLEAINVNSDRVTFDGSSVTVDPVDDLPANTNFSVQVDASAIRDTSGTVGSATLMSEDFEGLQLRDSGLATDDITIDVNNYVLVMTGVLDVKTAGDYTFGINSDDGQQLAIDVAQDGLDLIDDEIIYDDTTHGNQDRLSTCGSDAQNCAGSGDGPITLAVGEYAFEFWYFEAGGGSSGEFFYAPGDHETFSAADFVLVGDDSKGIGVTADGITATTYKSDVDVGNLTIAQDVVDGFDLASGFPQSATIPTADIWNSGGTGRFPDNHPLPGFPPPTFGDGTDWTDVGPFGWTRDNSDLKVNDDGTPGVEEYAGWTFLDKFFWINQQGNQNRLNFTKGENVVAVADPDAYDDFIDIGDGDPAGGVSTFNASLSSPAIYLDGVAENSAKVTFDSSWRDEDFQTAEVQVEYFDADDNSLGQNVVLRWESQAGDFFHDDMEDETVVLDLENPANAASMILTWDMPVAGNDWWWAVDNIKVEGNVAGDVFPDDSLEWNFNSFGAPTLGFAGSASLGEGDGDATLTIVRQGGSDTAVSVSYATSPGTASASDFTAASGTVDFAAGETEKTITIGGVVDDDLAEADESFNVTLSSPTGGAELDPGATTTTVTIVDNDRPVIVFQEGVEITIDGEGTGATYNGTTDADPAGASPDEFRDRAELNPDGEDGGSEVHGLTAFKDLFGDGPGQIPSNAVITKASLTLNVTNEGTPIRVHRLLAEFNEEEITWNDLMFNGNTEPGLQADGLEAVEVATTEFNATPAAVVDVDVTADVQLWYSGGAENFGWGFLPTGTNGVDWDSSEAATEANRPKLSVEFVIPPVEPVGPEIDLSTGAAAQSSQLGGFVAENALDNVANFTHTLAGDENPTWQVLLSDSYAFDNVTVFNRGASEGTLSCCPSRLRDITIQIVDFSGDVTTDFTGGVVTSSSELLNPENVLGGGTNTDGPISLSDKPGGAVGNLIRVIRTPDDDLSGTGGQGNDDEGSVLSIDLVVANGTLVPSADPFPGDINGDRKVDFSDFLILSTNFNQDVEPGTGGDFDGNGKVEFADFLVLSTNFNKSADDAPAAPPAAAAVDAALAISEDDDDTEDDLL